MVDFYWVNGSGNWSDYANHWASTSGGSDFMVRAPSAIDNAFFDANSFTADGQTVNIDNDEITCADMSWTGAIHNPTLSGTNKSMNILLNT